uniref:Chemokine (C-X-C motif) ligand 11, duplicate 5 n=1 Tax=Danio rerio TaxID=7955 RepID=A0A0R4IQ43_DANRE|nr:C-X-C motif chemokine 11-6-like [Danio rerio]|eukprot:XP_021332251.1 C-X-C motif chemokine 11-6-like [Danio rerio]
MKTAAFLVFLACLLATQVHGQKKFNRCSCVGKGLDRVALRNIEKFEIIHPSPSCGKQEIIVTMKSSEQKCLNPESKFTQELIRRALEKRVILTDEVSVVFSGSTSR